MGKTFKDKKDRLQYIRQHYELKKREECDDIVPFTHDDVQEEIREVDGFIEKSREGKLDKINADDDVFTFERRR